jgi:hypothetical protein
VGSAKTATVIIKDNENEKTPPAVSVVSSNLSGRLTGLGPFTVTVDGSQAEVSGDWWTKTVAVPSGGKTLKVRLEDAAGRVSEKDVKIGRGPATVNPVWLER